MKTKMRKFIIPLVALAILYSCEKSSEVDVIAEEGLIGVSLRLDKGFAVSNSDSSVDSSWPHIFQDLVDILLVLRLLAIRRRSRLTLMMSVAFLIHHYPMTLTIGL